jgi:hypothetical protein
MIESQIHAVFPVGGGGQPLVQPTVPPGGQPLVGQLTVHCIVSKESQGFDRPPLMTLIWSKDAIFDF